MSIHMHVHTHAPHTQLRFKISTPIFHFPHKLNLLADTSLRGQSTFTLEKWCLGVVSEKEWDSVMGKRGWQSAGGNAEA